MSLADIFPVDSYTCVKCGQTNKAGEYFPYRNSAASASFDRLCPECNKRKREKADAEQIASYVGGVEEPKYTDDITCPYCGHKEQDSWEHGDEDDEFECGHCGKKYSYERHTEVTYCSHRLE